jgi:hypothetical protein
MKDTAQRMEADLEALHARAGTLPFPIASVIDLYLTDTDDRDRIEDLRHTFEASSEFATSVLLAGLMADDDLFAASRPSLRGPGKGVASVLRTSSLGVWNMFGTALSVAVRRHIERGDGERVARAFGLERLAPVEALIDPAMWVLLDEAAVIRNRVQGHDPKLSRADRAEALFALEALLLRLLPVLERAFVGWNLLRLGTAQVQGGVLLYEGRVLTGAPRRFRPIAVPLRHVVDSDAIYLHGGGEGRPLRVAPFVRVVTDAERESEACYFYDRIENEEMRWKLFHTGADSEVSIMVPGVIGVLTALAQEASAATEGAVVAAVPSVPRTPSRQPGGVSAPPPLSTTSPAARPALMQPLVGMALADAVYPIAPEIDPQRIGLPLGEWLTTVTAAGIVIPGDQGQKLRSAFNIAHHRFARVGRGIWTWVPTDPTVEGNRLSGAALRDVAYEVAREVDPQRAGLHYENLKAELLRRGVPIAGPSQGRQVWSAIGSPAARSRFVALGKGKFVWRDEARAGVQPGKSEPERGQLQLPAGMAQFVESFSDLDAALLAVAPAIGRVVVGDEVIYTTGSEPIARVGSIRSRLRFTVAQPIDAVPHLQGVVVHRLALAGQANDATESWIPISGSRSVAGAAYLLAARHAAGEYPYLSDAFVRFMADLDDRNGHLFAPGWGDGDRPPVRLSESELHRFWSELLEWDPWVGKVTRRKAPKGARLGSPGNGGIYRTVRLDRFGVLATCWFGAESGFANGPDEIERRAAEIEARLGHPITVHVRGEGAWLADRVLIADARNVAQWPELWAAASDGLRTLLIAAEQDV